MQCCAALQTATGGATPVYVPEQQPTDVNMRCCYRPCDTCWHFSRVGGPGHTFSESAKKRLQNESRGSRSNCDLWMRLLDPEKPWDDGLVCRGGKGCVGHTRPQKAKVVGIPPTRASNGYNCGRTVPALNP